MIWDAMTVTWRHCNGTFSCCQKYIAEPIEAWWRHVASCVFVIIASGNDDIETLPVLPLLLFVEVWLKNTEKFESRYSDFH